MSYYGRRDLHHALRIEKVREAQVGGIAFGVAQLMYGKTDHAYALHARPNQWTPSGIQSTDVLALAGFRREECPAFGGECYVKEISEGFPLEDFACAFASARQLLSVSEQHLEACGLLLPTPEGWGYYYGNPSGGRGRRPSSGGGNGHTASESRSLKQSEDAYFRFRMTFGHFGAGRGWVFHYRPKNPPLTAEIWAAMEFLDAFQHFAECPEFDFEACAWRFVRYEEAESGHSSERHTEYVHRAFDSHQQHFSAGLEALLEAHATLAPFEQSFLPVAAGSPVHRPTPAPPRQAAGGVCSSGGAGDLVPAMPESFDVAVSFAGTERPLAEELAGLVRAAGFEVFYDDYYPEHLWGRDLVVLFDEIYGKRSRYCVIFTSAEYLDRAWTNRERQSAQAKAVAMKGADYILPIRVDGSELPGLPSTVGYVSLGERSIAQIAEILIRKLRQA